jgi:hypothetical protein
MGIEPYMFTLISVLLHPITFIHHKIRYRKYVKEMGEHERNG